jgi:hypothetical protein
MLQLLFSILLVGVSPTFESHTLDGRIITGTLKEISNERLILKTSDGETPFEIYELLDVCQKGQNERPLSPALSAKVWIETVDGSTIVAKYFTTKNEKAEITLLDDDKFDTPVKTIRSVRMQTDNESQIDQWRSILAKKRDSDVLVVRGDANLDYHAGVLSDVNAETVQFQLDGELLPIKRSKVFGIVYRHPSDESLPSPICRLIDAFGSQWQVKKLGLNGKLELVTPAGMAVHCSQDNILRIDYSAGKIAYLSDLKPDTVKWTPFFATAKNTDSVEKFFQPRLDCNFDSGPLQIAGKKYDKGLAIHSRTEMVYRLPDSFRRFKAVAGIDDSVRPQGNIQLTIRGDDKVLLDATISGTDGPKGIDLDISGTRRLDILVDYGKNTDVGDQLDLCNARIVK